MIGALAPSRARLAQIALIIAVGAIWTSSRDAAADRIAVRVVDLAAGNAYVLPGRLAGMVPGTKVQIGGRTFTIVEATERFSTIAIGKQAPVAVGDTGSAEVDPKRPNETTQLPPPRPLDTFKEQWPTAELPAKTQHVDAVPLGNGAGGGTTRFAVYGHLAGNLDKAGSGGQVEGRVVTSFSLMSDRPLAADLDGAVRLFGLGSDGGAKTPLFVRAAQVRYGDPADPSLLLGRLRYAATSVGMLDGGRAAFHTGNLELAAFGGLVPDPVSGHPDTGAARFGAELIYDRATSAWRPRLALAVHGSTWSGQLDERRLSVAASANKGATWLDAWLEADQFAPGNPWNAPAIDIGGAGASAEWRRRGSHLGIDVTFLRPERSLRLASVLSPSWQCARAPQPGSVAETCLGSDFWFATTASAGARGSWWTLDAIASFGQTQSVSTGADMSGYVRTELGHVNRLVLAGSGGGTLFAKWAAADLGFATTIAAGFDADLLYRPEQLDYVASGGSMLLHNLVADLRYAISPALDLAIAALATTGADRDTLALLTTIAWRPL